MTTAELDRKCDLMEAAMEALAADDWEKMLELNKQIVMTPKAAMQTFRMMGKERFLEIGFDLSAANEAFGEGWLDEEPSRRKFR